MFVVAVCDTGPARNGGQRMYIRTHSFIGQLGRIDAC